MENQEIERRYLMDESILTELDLSSYESLNIKQSYLSGKESAFSIRVRTSNDKGSICIKTGKGLVRSEHEYEVPLEDSQDLISKCDNSIEKVRYLIDHSELDVFGGDNTGKVILEIELESEEQEAIIPEVLEKYVIKEVTGNKKFSNFTMAHNTVRTFSTIDNLMTSP